MEIITSKTNSKIIEAKKLLQKKYRDTTCLFLVESKKVIQEAIKHNIVPKYFFVCENKDIKFLPKDVPIYQISEALLSHISSTVTPDGYIAVFKKPNQNTQYCGGNFLILDCLQNPDNLGAIMRTALATDFKQIYTINCVDVYSPKVLRASMGNQFGLNVYKISQDQIKILFKNASLYTASMEGKNLFKTEIKNDNVGVVIGNEGNGVSEEIKKLIPNIISIPMKNGVESLNASVSASVIMYHLANFNKHN